MDTTRRTTTKIIPVIVSLLAVCLCLSIFAYKANAQAEISKSVYIELASASFSKDDYAKSLHYLKQALRLDPSDAYANELIAAIYFLQGKHEAALIHWNRVSMPYIKEIKTDASLKTDPVILNRSFAFAPEARVFLSEISKTKARLDAMRIFSVYKIEFAARPDGNFDINVNAVERGRGSKTEKALSMFRGLPYQAVHLDFINIKGHAINFESMARWDKNKRRYTASLSGPLGNSMKRFYRINTDWRNENWNLFAGAANSYGSFNMQKAALSADVLNVVTGSFSWSTGAEISYRNFRNSDQIDSSNSSSAFTDGIGIKHKIKADYDLIDNPEKRFETTLNLSAQTGRMLSGSRNVYSKVQGGAQLHWQPQSTGDDYEMRGGISSGKLFGASPFDEMFILGYERDNDLMMRAHVGTLDGKKGISPMGSSFVLTNFEVDKNLYENGLLKFKLGPFFDSGKILSKDFEFQKWLFDVGLQSKVKVLGIGAAFTYGKDLRSGNNAFYISVSK